MASARKRQTRLQLSALTSSPPLAATLPSSSLSVSGQKRKRSQKNQTKLEFPSATEEYPSIGQMPSPVSLRGKGKKVQDDATPEDDIFRSSAPQIELHSSPFKRIQRKRSTRLASRTVAESSSSTSSEDEQEGVSPKKVGSPTNLKRRRIKKMSKSSACFYSRALDLSSWLV